MAKNTLIASPDVLAAAEGLSSMAQSSLAGPREASAKLDTQHSKDAPDTTQSDNSKAPISRYFDALAAHLRIDYWTNVSVTSRYAAGAISMYLETEHLMLRLFDPETFLNDLINTNSDYCSAFLVNSLLALASQIYVKEDPKASTKSLEFEKEARLLWRADSEDSIPNLAGLIFLYIAMANNGNGDQGAANYVFEAGEMAKRMQLFGVHDKIAASRPQLRSEEAKYALRQASWGLFNIYNLIVHFWIALPLEHPPAVPIPDKPDEVWFDDTLLRFVRVSGKAAPDDEAFVYLSKLCRIDSEALILLRDPELSRPPPLAFTFSKYRKLLELINSIPKSISRTGNESAAVLLFHMYFHRCVMDLFRPYIIREKTPQFKAHHADFDTPEAIFRASTQQLKGLLIEYTAYPHFASCLMWHPTLTYTASSTYMALTLFAPSPRNPRPSEKQYITILPDGTKSAPKQLPCWLDKWAAEKELAKKEAAKAPGTKVVIPPQMPIEEAELFMTVVVPAYNEEERMGGMLEEAVDYLQSQYGSAHEGAKGSGKEKGWEILIVSDGSTDGTVDKALEFAKEHQLSEHPVPVAGPWTKNGTEMTLPSTHIPHGSIRVITLEENRGKGGAVTHGMRHARGQYIVFADADGASRFSDLGKLVEGCKNIEDTDGRGVAIGSRAHLVGSEAVVKRSKLRNFLMYSFHLLLRVMTPAATARIKDTQCGFKLFSRPALPYIVPYMHSEGWIFDVEMLMLAESADIAMIEVAIGWKEVMGMNMQAPTQGQSDAGELCKAHIYTFGDQQQPTYTEVPVNTFLRDDYNVEIFQDGLTRIHLPVNNMIWAKMPYINWDEYGKYSALARTASKAICPQDFQRNYGHKHSAFDDHQELQLVLEVADIFDELKILKSLFEKQGVVIATLSPALGLTKTLHDSTDPCRGFRVHRKISSQESSRIANASDHNTSVIAVLSNLDAEAKDTYSALMELLDLKSKTASLAEARATTKQGNAVMLFTVVTIIFVDADYFSTTTGLTNAC
ncbi:dolichyl-phosphate beta-glucosyltransferase, partial [Didymella keratinophila]